MAKRGTIQLTGQTSPDNAAAGKGRLLWDDVAGEMKQIDSSGVITSLVGGGSGDMATATYDPAAIAEQLVGLTAVQTLTNKTINGVTLSDAGAQANSLREDGTYVAAAGGGDMTAAVYDPAAVSEQLVGLTAIQTMTNKTLTAPVLTTPTADMLDIVYSATQDDDRALGINCDANGFGDIRAININYITGTLAAREEEAATLVSIDNNASTGGEIAALEVLSTAGASDVDGMVCGIGIGAIKQFVGVFTDMDSALVNAVDRLTEFTTPGSDVQILVADNDTVTIGNLAKYSEIEFLFAIFSSQHVLPTFEYSTGIGTWALFNPIDGTDGMRNNGVIAWNPLDIPGWLPGLASEYLIRITRTRNTIVTPPTESFVQIAESTLYSWDENGDLIINDLTAGGETLLDVGDGNSLSITAAGGVSIDSLTGSGKHVRINTFYVKGTMAYVNNDFQMNSGGILGWTATGDGGTVEDTNLYRDSAGVLKTDGDIIIDGLTASEIVITDGTKKIVSAAVVTYPSLAELAFVKGLSSAVQTQIDSKEDTANKNVNNGYAPLDASALVPLANLPASVQTGSEYKGVYNATTNVPTIIDGTGANGDYYRVEVGGTQDFGAGSIVFDVGDLVLYNGTTLVWEKVDGNPDLVTSVAGKQGIVTLVAADITDFDTEVGNNATVALNTAKLTNVTTNLSTTQTATTVDVVSSDGTDATLPQAIAAGNAGVMSGADKTKIDGIAAGATVGVATEDEGISVDTTATILNFIGSGVAATDAGGGQTDITISGGGDMTVAVYDAAGVSEQLVGLTAIQTMTNKTLTAPIVNSPTGIVKADVGLANVDNTTDAAKPISTATQTALDLKLANVVEDTAPQLGGVLDTNAFQVNYSKGIDVASIGSLVLGTDGNYFDITGVTAITSIGTLGIGTQVTLRFTGILVLTFHATDLILPTGASITTAVGDTADFIEYAAGDWICTNYNRADGTAVAGGGSGDMLISVYDAATVSEQLVGLTAIQTMTNKTLTAPIVNSPTGIVAADISDFDAEVANEASVVLNTAKLTNVTTNLTTTQTATTVDVVSSDGTDATLPQAIAAGNAGVMSGADKTKLDGITALADVTNTSTVTAAGALMDSEVDVDIKTLVLPADTTISTFGASLVDDTTAALARATLEVNKFDISFQLSVGENTTFNIHQYASFGYTIDAAYYKTTSGTITANIQIDAVSVTGLSALAVTSTEGNASSSALDTVAIGNTVTIVTTADSTAVNLSVTLHCSRT